MQPPYTTFGFIETLRAEKHGLMTYLIDPPTDVIYGYIVALGPLKIFKMTGWHGEKIAVVKLFGREFVW